MPQSLNRKLKIEVHRRTDLKGGPIWVPQWLATVLEKRWNVNAKPLVTLFLAALPISSDQGPQKLTPVEAAARVGQIATVCAVVASVRCELPAKTTVVTLSGPAGAEPFRVTITSASRRSFGPGLEDRLDAREVCVTGTIERFPAGLQITATRADQLQPQGPEPPIAGDVYSVCDDGISPPQLLSDVKPNYTASAMSARAQGVIVLEGVISRDGIVTDVRVVQPLHPELDAEAVRAFQQWRFQPGTHLGTPVPIKVQAEMTFSLRSRR
jgi:TonB family protein